MTASQRRLNRERIQGSGEVSVEGVGAGVGLEVGQGCSRGCVELRVELSRVQNKGAAYALENRRDSTHQLQAP